MMSLDFCILRRAFFAYLSPSDKVCFILILSWLLLMIAVPIFYWFFGDVIFRFLVPLALFLQFFATVSAVLLRWHLYSVLIVFCWVAGVAWLFEFFGSHFGFPFGGYDYTKYLQPKIFGVPLLIPLAWFMMLAPSWVIANLVVPKNKVYTLAAYVFISALAVTAWDLFLDPQMVAWGFWIWEKPAPQSLVYFGIPWSNFAGWMLTAIIATTLARPWRYELQPMPLLTIYGIAWILESIGLAIFWGQPGPALVGFVTMGSLLWWAVSRYLKTKALVEHCS